MTRRAPLARRSSLRRASKKRQAGRATFAAVYAEVDRRSRGRCEVPWCRRSAVDHHHTVKPRASHHRAELVIALCRAHHEQAERAYAAGRLVIAALGAGRFRVDLVTAPDKWAGEAR